jgi:UDP-glucose 4-epimerase
LSVVLLGGSGIVGSGFRAVLDRRGAEVRRLSPRWRSSFLASYDIEGGLPALLPADGPATVVWAAGVGHVGASAELMQAENDGLRALCRAVTRLPPARRERLRVLFASSAGAVFGASGSAEVGPDSEPRPGSAYGEQKLRQESELRRLSEASGCSVLVCRISNAYGLATGRLGARGLVSAAVRATRLRQPLTVYVSADTRRDYVYNEDLAGLSLRLLDDAPTGFATALVRDGSSRTVAEVLSVVGRVSGRRVPATYADRPETRLQPRVLRFTASPAGPDAVRRTPMEVAVHLMLRAPMADQPLSTSLSGSKGSNGSSGASSSGTG